MPVNKNIIQICRKAILFRLGSLMHISYELANTVANVYYRFFDVFNHKIVADDGFVDNKALFDDLDLQVTIREVYENPGAMLIETIDALQSITESQFLSKKIGDAGPLIKMIGLDPESCKERTRVFVEFRFINAIIGYLRILQNHEQFAYNMMMIECILDAFKYRISKVTHKSPIRRKIERMLKKKKVDEIPNLVDLLGVMKSQKAVFRVTRKELDDYTEEKNFMQYLGFYHLGRK